MCITCICKDMRLVQQEEHANTLLECCQQNNTCVQAQSQLCGTTPPTALCCLGHFWHASPRSFPFRAGYFPLLGVCCVSHIICLSNMFNIAPLPSSSLFPRSILQQLQPGCLCSVHVPPSPTTKIGTSISAYTQPAHQARST